jgi:hypothetical protein
MMVCGCGHLVTDHNDFDGSCTEWWRYPDVLDTRRCGCKGIWNVTGRSNNE